MKHIISLAILLIFLSACGSSVDAKIQSTIAPIQTNAAIYEGTSAAELSFANNRIFRMSEIEGTQQAKYDMSIHTLATKDAKIDSLIREIAIQGVAQSPCPNPANIIFNMSGNTSVSESLKNYIGDSDSSVTKADWEVIWNNDRAAIHNIYGQYKHVFLVRFKGDLFPENKIYYIDMNCFFDLTK